MLKEVYVGQTVYFKCHKTSGCIRCGTIRSVDKERLSSKHVRIDVYIDVKDAPYSGTRRSPASLFLTEQACRQQIKVDAGELDVREVYRKEIHSVKDLMAFIFSNDISRRENNAARDVALEKAEELFGYDISSLINANKM